MFKEVAFTIGTKCAPKESIFLDIKNAGISVVELYLTNKILEEFEKIVDLCGSFPFKYSVHAPTDSLDFYTLGSLVEAIGAEIVVFHNIYWEHEWENIIEVFKKIRAKICIENISSIHETIKFKMRYGMGICLDLEHLQLECSGLYEEEFIKIIKNSTHIHMSGYCYGSQLWHTHIHYSPENSIKLLNLLKEANYSGFVISEARLLLQNFNEFKRLNDFYTNWSK